MNNLFIYNYVFYKRKGEVKTPTSVTCIFVENYQLSLKDAQNEIKQYFEKNIPTDKILIIGGCYLETTLNDIFITEKKEVFRFIPKVTDGYLDTDIFVCKYDDVGFVECINKATVPFKSEFKKLFNEGLVKIFKERGGLIESEGSHHFVFPSGKHCNKFLRTGNILLHSSEIYFIAFCLLEFLKGATVTKISCDTSSISTLAFAVQDIKRRIIGDAYKMLPVDSFSSYEGIIKASIDDLASSFILISSSTSANIINRILDAHNVIQKRNIIILYFLGDSNSYTENKEQILCNLTKSDSNPNGIVYYDTYGNSSECVHCKSGSHAIEIRGDVFLLEKPKVNRIKIKKSDAPKYLSDFMEEFRSKAVSKGNVLRINYKEKDVPKPGLNYDIYIDFHAIVNEVSRKNSIAYSKFKQKLFAYINQYIPSNTKYIVSLEDEGSKSLSKLILKTIKDNYASRKAPVIIGQNDVSTKISESTNGSIVIVASVIANGKNLLYLSRALRKYDNVRIVYFIGLVRMKNVEMYDFLKSNLKQGQYGVENSTLVDVLNINCNNEVKNTCWHIELNFLKELKDLVDEQEEELLKFVSDRIIKLQSCENISIKGIANDLFYNTISSNIPLELRKGFAFFDFSGYHKKVSQADVYFTISNVLNNLRNVKKTLVQSEYVRNLIDPGNFNRFNDGIIQSSLLRSAYLGELSYDIDNEMSIEMMGILETMIKYHTQDQGEALLEFLYALACQKLTLKKDHLKIINELAISTITNPFALLLCKYIKNTLLTEPVSLVSKIHKLEEKIKRLESEKIQS